MPPGGDCTGENPRKHPDASCIPIQGSMMAKVLVLSLSPLRRDPRVLRQIALLKEHHEVHTAGYGAAPEGVFSHVEVPAKLRVWRSNYRHFYALSAARAFDRLYFGAPWVKYLRGEVDPGTFDIILANDANAAPLARALEPRLGWHADLHEYATRQGEDNPTWRRFTRPVNTWMVRKHVSRADSVTTVSQGLADAYGEEFDIECLVVPNAAPYREDLFPRPTASAGPLRLVYSGAMVSSRRLEYMIDAVGIAESQSPGSFLFDLFVMPGEKSYRAMLEERAAAVGGAIRLMDPVPYEKLIPTMARYDVGFYACPPLNFNQERALPNKLFEFVQARLAIVSGPSLDMARCITEHSLGLVSDGFSPDDLARTLLSLDPEGVDRHKQASHAAARVLSSERASTPWKDAIDAIAGYTEVAGCPRS